MSPIVGFFPINLIEKFVIVMLPQRIQYAKEKSDCIAKADGTYVIREKKKKQEEKGEMMYSELNCCIYILIVQI